MRGNSHFAFCLRRFATITAKFILLQNTMTNILLNYYNFDGDWTEGKLEKYFRNKHVLVLPLAYRESQAWDLDSWLSVYGKGGEKYDSILRPFLSYGIAEKDVEWLNFYQKGCDFRKMIRQSDVLFFTGGMPEKAIARLETLGLVDEVKNFRGVVAGASAGAMLQLEKYHITPDEDYESYGIFSGLGLVGGFDLEVHFLNTELQQQCTRRALKDLGCPVYSMWHEGGLLVENGEVTVLGNVWKNIPAKNADN